MHAATRAGCHTLRTWPLYHVRSTHNKREPQVLQETLTCDKYEAMQTSAAVRFVQHAIVNIFQWSQGYIAMPSPAYPQDASKVHPPPTCMSLMRHAYP